MSGDAQPQPENTVVTQERPAQLVSRDNVLEEILVDVFGPVVGPELNNFDGTEQDKWRLTSIATGPTVQTFAAIDGRAIAIKYFYVHTVEVDGNTPGEFIRAVRCVLIEPGLTAYGFVSNVLAQDLARMVRTFGLQPWNPAIEVKVIQTPAKRGHFYNLIPAN